MRLHRKVYQTAVHTGVVKYQNEGIVKGREMSARLIVYNSREDRLLHEVVSPVIGKLLQPWRHPTIVAGNLSELKQVNSFLAPPYLTATQTSGLDPPLDVTTRPGVPKLSLAMYPFSISIDEHVPLDMGAGSFLSRERPIVDFPCVGQKYICRGQKW